MNSGHETGPEDPPEAPESADAPAPEDRDIDWATWRQGPGYSRPVPPDPEPGPGREPEDTAGKPAAGGTDEGRVPRQPPDSGDPVWTSKRSPAAQRAYQPPGSGAEGRPRRPAAPYEPGTYRTPGSHQESTGYGAPPPAAHERGSYPPPGPQPYQASSADEPPPYDVPKPRPYQGGGETGSPGRYGGAGNHGASGGAGDPEAYDERSGYNEPIDYRPDDADSGASRDEPGRYRPFREPEGRGSGPHASPTRPAPPPPLPGVPGNTSVYRSPAGRRQLVVLGAAVAVVVAAGITAAVLLLSPHGKPRHPTAGGHPAGSGHSRSASPSAPASPPPSPPLTGASGRLRVPSAIGSLRLNPALTDKFVGSAVRHRDASSFVIPKSDVVSGFYTSDPAATAFTAKQPRIMFLAAYLNGTGHAKTALHDFMTNSTFTGQHRVSAGPRGGVAACGLLPQKPTPVAHCMWADANSYADFYAWNSSQSALAKTMLSVRPRIERSRH